MVTNLQKIFNSAFIIFILQSFALQSQDLDLHFSQFHLAPAQQNPALTGVFDGDLRFTGIYRRQWQSVPVDYLTIGGAIDGVLHLPFPIPGSLAAGGIIRYDEAGDAQLQYSEIGLALSWSYPLTEIQSISVGFRAGQVSRRFSESGLRWDLQYDGELFNPNLSSQEDFEAFQGSSFNTGAGFNWHLRWSERAYLNAGWGIRNFTNTSIQFTSATLLTWALRQTFFVEGSLTLSEQLDMRFAGMGQLQSKASEWLVNAGLRYHLPREGKSITSLSFNFGIRAGDALIPSLAIGHGPWLTGISYDINTSPFSRATNGKGGPELMVVYIIRKVPPPEAFRSCPIF